MREAVTLAEKGLVVKHSTLDALDALVISQIGMDPGIGERPVLSDGLVLQIWGAKIRQRVLAGKVLIAIFPDVRTEVKDRTSCP